MPDMTQLHTLYLFYYLINLILSTLIILKDIKYVNMFDIFNRKYVLLYTILVLSVIQLQHLYLKSWLRLCGIVR